MYKLVIKRTGRTVGTLIGSNRTELVVQVSASHIRRIPKSNAAAYAVIKGA